MNPSSFSDKRTSSYLEEVDLTQISAEYLDRILEDCHPADLAAALTRLEADQRLVFLQRLEIDDIVELAAHLPSSDVANFLENASLEEQKELVACLADDVRVDVLQDLESASLREQLLLLLPEEERNVTEDLITWPEESAGGRMTRSIAWIRADYTIKQAIKALRQKQEYVDFLSRLFVVDESRHILGQLRLRDLVFHRFGEQLEDIMEPVEFTIRAEADQEEAAQMIQRYDLVALPVVDANRRLLGAITADDAFEILEEEITEDVEKSAAITPSAEGETYIGSSWFSLVKRRFLWVFILAVVGTFSGMIIYQFEGTLSHFFHLALYMPMVVAAGGNTGGQAATMVIRAMSLGEVVPRDALRIGARELKVGASLGVLMAVAIGVQICLLLPFRDQLPSQFSSWNLGVVVALSVLAQIVSSTMLGAMLPLGARKLGIDPAAVASPVLASIVDITGLLIYFGIAQLLLGV